MPLCNRLHRLCIFCTESLGLHIVSSTSPVAARSIRLQLGDLSTPLSSTEAYSLTVDTEQELISVSGQTAAGVFYGVQTLVNLAFPDGQLPALTLRDWPRFQYRGLHVDVVRNFHSDVTHMKKLLDVMATYKLNRLHFHLSDDEGWRLQIPGLPELTEVLLIIHWTRKLVPNGHERCCCCCSWGCCLRLVSTKAFSFHNRSSSNFAYRLATILCTIAP